MERDTFHILNTPTCESDRQSVNADGVPPDNNLHLIVVSSLPPVMNMPGADGTQARHCTDAAAEGKQKEVIHARASLSTSLMPLWRLDTEGEETVIVWCLRCF